MRKITSPVGNPERKWILIHKLYYNVRRNKQGEMQPVIEKNPDKNYGIADVNYYGLAGKDGTLNGEPEVICLVYDFWDHGPALQNWGFIDDIHNSKACIAISCDGKNWMLVEKNDRLSIETDNSIPYKTVTLTVRNNSGTVQLVVKRK